MFLGTSAEGINREVSSTIECARLCKNTAAKPLAIPETAIFNLAILSKKGEFPQEEAQYYPETKDIAKGILPSLRHLISRETRKKAAQMSIPILPDSSQDIHKSEFTFDPYANDFYCKICNSELANQYFRCDGCVHRLNQDLKICLECHESGKYFQYIIMKPETDDNTLSPDHHHHMAEGVVKCPATCNCQHCCHTKFSRRLRFFSDVSVSQMILNLQALRANDEDEVPYAENTLERLNGLLLLDNEENNG